MYRCTIQFQKPALSLLPGHTPAQAARCPALLKTLMSVPISAMMFLKLALQSQLELSQLLAQALLW